jgi:Holliday junction resolvase
MQLWNECGNGQGWFAIKVPTDEIYMLPLFVVMAYKSRQSSLSYAEIHELGKALDVWVKKCK